MDAAKILDVSLTAWRRTRHPRWALLAEWATRRALAAAPRPLVGAGGTKAAALAWEKLDESGDALDVPRLLAAVGKARSPVAAVRVEVLARRNDPRVVAGLLALLEAPPYRARTATGFFRAACAALGASGDPRARDGLADLAGRYRGIVETTMGVEVAALCRRTAAEMGEVAPAELTPEDERRLAELEALFPGETAASAGAAAATTRRRRSDAELLAEVYRAPDDDGPRLVFADVLSERGDPRGELIALQVARARGTATPDGRRRERELLLDAKRRAGWGLPLSAGGECTLERGFPAFVELQARSARTLIGNDAWATVRSVAGLHRLSAKGARDLMRAPQMVRVREVSGVTSELLDALEAPLPWTTLGALFVPTREQLARLPGLVSLSIQEMVLYIDGQRRVFPADPLAGAPGLRALTLRWPEPPGPDFFAPVPGLRELSIEAVYPPTTPLAPATLRPLTGLTCLYIHQLPAAELLHGLPITHLGCAADLTPAKLRELLGGLPNLVTLELRHLPVPEVFAALVAAASGSRIERFTIGGFTVIRPAAPGATVEWRGFIDPGRIALYAAALPPGAVTRVVLVPPDRPAVGVVPPTDEAIRVFRQSFREATVEVDWD